MTSPTGSMRKLQYPLNRTEDMESVVGAEAINNIDLSQWSTVDSDEQVSIVMNLSLNEYVALASSIDVGRDIAYGDNSIYIWWLWVRSLEAMAICDAIVECIETTPEIQDLIAQYGIGATPETIAIESPANLSKLLIDNRAGCDNDIIFGMAGGLVDMLDSVARRILSLFQSAVSPAGRIGDMIEAIPVIGELPVDDIFQFTEAMMNDIAGGYDGAYDSILRNDIACDLFCIASTDCLLSLEDARDVYQVLFAQTIDTSNLLNFLLSMIGNIYSGQATVYGLHLLILELMIFGARVEFVDVDRLTNTVLAMFNDPDSDWSILCTDCETWEHTFDFTVADGSVWGWAQGAWGDGWVSGKGWQSQANGTTQELDYIELTPASDIDITYVQFNVVNEGAQTTYGSAGWNPNVSTRLLLLGSTVNLDLFLLSAKPTTYSRVGYSGVSETIDLLTIKANPLLNDPNKFHYTSCTMRGTGVNPFV